MTELAKLAAKRAEHEALKQVLVGHGRCVTDCPCWHDDAHGVRHLKERLEHMWRLADRLEDTLGDIRRIETAFLSR